MESKNDSTCDINFALKNVGGLSPEMIVELERIRTSPQGNNQLFFLAGLQAQRMGKTPSELINEWNQIVNKSREAQYSFMELFGRVPFRP